MSLNLSKSASPVDFHDAAQHSLNAFDALNRQIIEERKVKLACCEGCSLCCWLRVDVFAHEAFLIAHHISNHFTDDQVADLMTRLAAHAEKVMPLTPFEHATQNTVCPLLQNG